MHRRVTARVVAAAVALTATACSALPGAKPDEPRPSLTLDASLPEFHGEIDVRVAAALNIFPAGGCQPEPGVICGRGGRVEYRPAEPPVPVTLTDATMALDDHEQYWEVRIEFDRRRPLATVRRRARGFGGTVLVVRGTTALATGPYEAVEGATLVVGHLDKAEAYRLLEGLRAV